MYELVGEIVEMVCSLLTIVEAVMRIPGIPTHSILNLKSAKEGLYNVTSASRTRFNNLRLTFPPIPRKKTKIQFVALKLLEH